MYKEARYTATPHLAEFFVEVGVPYKCRSVTLDVVHIQVLLVSSITLIGNHQKKYTLAKMQRLYSNEHQTWYSLATTKSRVVQYCLYTDVSMPQWDVPLSCPNKPLLECYQ